MARKKKVSMEEQLKEFKESIDFLIDVGDWNLTESNILGHTLHEGICNSKILYLSKEARIYLEDAREKVRYYEKSETKQRDYSILKPKKKIIVSKEIEKAFRDALRYLSFNNVLVNEESLNDYIKKATGQIPEREFYYTDEHKQDIAYARYNYFCNYIKNINPDDFALDVKINPIEKLYEYLKESN